MISVIIPTLNEETALPSLLNRLAKEPARHEVVVVDGGSRDRTVALAESSGARVVLTPPGRGQQLAAGVRVAGGDILLFLHADSRFPKGGMEAIERAMASARVVGGNFRLLFDGDDGFSRWLNGFYAAIRRRGFYYGDSGVFVRRPVHDSLGGIRPIALMEDYDFVRRLESAGPTVCIETPPLVTSARRFVGRHPLAIVTGWLAIHALFHLGAPPSWLARLYDSMRRRTRHA
ncbi:MAG: glycosyltransferase [Acidimicrobiia bacterium]|nr:glycosyltransferase [Acidimicrobiia bacterium]